MNPSDVSSRLNTFARSAVLQLVEERLRRMTAGGSDDDFTRYLSALVDHHLFSVPAESAATREAASDPTPEPVQYPPWDPDCTCGACDAEDCKCEAWDREFRPAPPLPDPPSAAAGVVEVELRPVHVAKREAIAPEPLQPALSIGRNGNGHATKGAQVPAAAAPTEAERQARDYIIERVAAAGRSYKDDAPRIETADLMAITGWHRNECIKFTQRVLDELRAAGRSKVLQAPREAGLGALIAAINQPSDDEDDDIDGPSEADLDEVIAEIDTLDTPDPPKPAPAPAPARRTQQSPEEAMAHKRELSAKSAARVSAKRKGQPFDEAAWLTKYRAPRAKAGAAS